MNVFLVSLPLRIAAEAALLRLAPGIPANHSREPTNAAGQTVYQIGRLRQLHEFE